MILKQWHMATEDASQVAFHPFFLSVFQSNQIPRRSAAGDHQSPSLAKVNMSLHSKPLTLSSATAMETKLDCFY